MSSPIVAFVKISHNTKGERKSSKIQNSRIFYIPKAMMHSMHARAFFRPPVPRVQNVPPGSRDSSSSSSSSSSKKINAALKKGTSSGEKRTTSTPSLGSRRSTCISFLAAAALAVLSDDDVAFAATLNNNNGNSAILQALKQKQNADDVEFASGIRTRLSLTLAAFRRAKLLSDVGEYANARQLLREGGASSLRKDLQKVASYVALRRPTFNEYEAAETIGTLEAWDNAMRAMEVPEKQRKGDQRNVTANDVRADAEAAVRSLEEVVYLVNADATYVDAQKRLKNVDLEKEYLDE